VTATGEADVRDITAKAGPRTRLITTSHLHNVFGTVTTLEELDLPVLRCFDCSQSAGHLPLDVAALGADFAAFSAHKMFGMPGLGILYAARHTHPDLQPFLPGGFTGPVMPTLLRPVRRTWRASSRWAPPSTSSRTSVSRPSPTTIGC
jgi:cysteine desulfurase/selenocysteine lyase